MSSAQAATTRESIIDDAISITPAARQKFAELLAEADDDISAIRIFVSGGGCSGMTYGMTYTDAAAPYDRVIEGEGYTLLVDAVALNYLEGCEIDFTTRGVNQTFVFNNVFSAVGGSGGCGGCGGACG